MALETRLPVGFDFKEHWRPMTMVVLVRPHLKFVLPISSAEIPLLRLHLALTQVELYACNDRACLHFDECTTIKSNAMPLLLLTDVWAREKDSTRKDIPLARELIQYLLGSWT